MAANDAVTLALPFIVRVQLGDVPEHAPDQPVKVELASGVAVRVTDVPWAKVVPVGFVVIVPVPVPVLLTARLYVEPVVKLTEMVWFAVTFEKMW